MNGNSWGIFLKSALLGLAISWSWKMRLIYIYTHMIWCNCWRQTGFSATGLHFPICFPWQRSYASASFTMLSWNLAQMIYTPKANGVTWKRSTLEKAKKTVNQPTPSNLGLKNSLNNPNGTDETRKTQIPSSLYRYFEKNTWTFFVFTFPYGMNHHLVGAFFGSHNFYKQPFTAHLQYTEVCWLLDFWISGLIFLSMNLMTLCVVPKGMNRPHYWGMNATSLPSKHHQMGCGNRDQPMHSSHDFSQIVFFTHSMGSLDWLVSCC